YPLTDAAGVTIQVNCPAQMQADVDAKIAETTAKEGQPNGIATLDANGEVVQYPKVLTGMVGNIQSPLTSLPMKRMSASDSVVDINITAVTGLSTTLEGMDFYNPVAIAALPSGVDLTGSIVRDFTGNEFSCYYHTPASNTMGLATPKGAGFVLATGAATASVRRLQGDFSGKETFSRYSTGTYIDSLTGLVKTALPNEMRFERMADGGVGALLEGTSTNKLLNSSVFGNSADSILLSATATNHTAISPSGAADALSLTELATSSLHGLWKRAPAVGALVTAASSIYLKAELREWVVLRNPDTNSNGTCFNLRTGLYGTAGNNGVTTEYTGNGWWRLSASSTLLADGVGYTEIFMATDAAGTTTYLGDTTVVAMYYWGAQLEALPFATSYIPTTTAAVTRAADNLTIPFSGNAPRFDAAHANPMSLVMDVELHKWGAGRRQHMFSSSLNHEYLLRNDVDNSTHMFGGADVVACYFPAPIQGVRRLAVSISADKTSVKGYTDGVAGANGSINSTSWGASSTLTIGSWNGVDYMYGHIRNFRIYDQALTDAEVSAA
ncbi:MAG: LamG-like jellyroll fold domain-containing protein, partial [Ghiorsea sp.]